MKIVKVTPLIYPICSLSGAKWAYFTQDRRNRILLSDLPEYT